MFVHPGCSMMVLDSRNQNVSSVLEASGAGHRGSSVQDKLPAKRQWPGRVVRGLWIHLSEPVIISTGR